MRAALCYAIPFVPACVAILKRGEHPYVRLHAARALLFFACVALAQFVLLGLLVVGGAYATGLRTGALLGLVAWAYIFVEFVVVLRVWRRSLAAALGGMNPRAGRLGRSAAALDRWTLAVVDALSLRWERLTARVHPAGRYDDHAWR